MTQLIANVLRQDEEKRRIREAAFALFPPDAGLYYDDMTRRVYDAADVQADQMAAIRNPFAEFAMPAAPPWDRGEYTVPTLRYRAP